MNTNVSKVLLVFAIMFCANLVFAQNQIEFDGGYINTQKGKYLEMKEKQTFVTQITIAGMSMMAVFDLPKNYYVVDKEGMLSISSGEFKGVAIKGQHKFKNFSLHPLVVKRLKDNEGLFEIK